MNTNCPKCNSGIHWSDENGVVKRFFCGSRYGGPCVDFLQTDKCKARAVEARLDVMGNALKFYANPMHWNQFDETPSDAVIDGGDKARAALNDS